MRSLPLIESQRSGARLARSWLRPGLTVLVLFACWASLGEASHSTDRLDLFRELVRARLAPAQQDGTAPNPEALRALEELLDEEILENLNSGAPFSSEAFIQERLEGFSGEWGWGSFEARRLRTVPSVLVASVRPLERGEGSSVRFYLPLGGRYSVAHVVQRDASPLIGEMPPAGGSSAQLLLAWLGARSGQETFPANLELVRLSGETGRTVWSSRELFPDGLDVFDLSMSAEEVTVRYPGQYAGRKPGCKGQTERIDTFRYDRAKETMVLGTRRQTNGWHQELYERSVHPLLDALKSGNASRLTALVPSAELRRRLPPGLELLSVCDESEPPSGPTEVRISVEPASGQPSPLTLLFRKSPRGWALSDVKSEE